MSQLDPQNHASDLIEFYSAGTVSNRNLELIKHRLERKTQKLKDPELVPYAGYRQALKELQMIHSRRVHSYGHATLNPTLQYLLQLKPEDFFILLSHHRYQIPDEELSIILDASIDHLRFRRKQIIDTSTDFSVDTAELEKTCTAPLEKVSKETQHSQVQRKDMFERFRSLPLPARFLFETGVVLSVLIFLMWLIPEVRNRYENSIQKRINDYMIESTISDAPAPDGTSKTPRIVEQSHETTAAIDEAAEAAEIKAAQEASNKKPLKVIDGETWRFSFTGPATNDILTGITNTLEKSGMNDVKPITVPGGIQFDFMAKSKELQQLKINLEEMTLILQRRASGGSSDAPATVNMSWYKKKNIAGRKIPQGHVEVVIWISTL